MSKKVLQIILSLLVIFSLCSTLLPLIKVKVPVFGVKTVTVFQAVKDAIPKSTKQTKSPIPIKIETPKEIPGISNIKKMITENLKKQGINIFKEKPSFIFAPLGILSGVVAHILLLVIVILVFLKKYRGAFISAVLSCISAVIFLIGLFKLNELIQYVMAGPMKGLEGSPLAGLSKLTAVATPNITLSPGIALYVLIGTTLFIAIVSWLTNRQTS